MHWIKNRLAWLSLNFYFIENNLALSSYATLVKLGIKKSTIAMGMIKIIKMIRPLYRYPIESSSAVRTLKLDILLDLAVELSRFYQHRHITHFISGSIGYWIIAGTRNKPLFFGDLDMVVVDANRDLLFKELSRSGWHVEYREHGLKVYRANHKLSACIFFWVIRGDHADEINGRITHLSKMHLVPTKADISGKSIYVASIKYIEAIRPVIYKKRSLTMANKAISSKSVGAELYC